MPEVENVAMVKVAMQRDDVMLRVQQLAGRLGAAGEQAAVAFGRREQRTEPDVERRQPLARRFPPAVKRGRRATDDPGRFVVSAAPRHGG